MPVFEINGRRILGIHILKNASTSISEYLGRHFSNNASVKASVALGERSLARLLEICRSDFDRCGSEVRGGIR